MLFFRNSKIGGGPIRSAREGRRVSMVAGNRYSRWFRNSEKKKKRKNGRGVKRSLTNKGGISLLVRCQAGHHRTSVGGGGKSPEEKENMGGWACYLK